MTKLILVFVLFVTVDSFGQNSPQEIIDDFFKNYEQKGAKEALDKLYETNKWMSRKTDAVNNVKNEFARFDDELVGKYYGYVFIDKIETSDCYAIHTYFLKFGRQPLRLTFAFYKADKDWMIYGFKFDDSFDVDFEKALIWKYSSKE